jgi:hypothetical protein
MNKFDSKVTKIKYDQSFVEHLTTIIRDLFFCLAFSAIVLVKTICLCITVISYWHRFMLICH